MRSVTIALTAGLALLAVAIGVVLQRSPLRLVSENGRPVEERLEVTNQGGNYCQGGEYLPAKTTVLRFWIYANTGPRVSVVVSTHGHTIASGEQESGWTAAAVSVPVKPLPHAVTDATVCLAFQMHNESMIIFGKPTPPAIAARNGSSVLPGRIWIEYLRPSTDTWASRALAVARRMGLGRAAAGTWVALLALVLLATLSALASRLVLKELR